MDPADGDKVKLKSHHGAPARGVVEAVHGNEVLVRLDESGELVAVASEMTTNFSLAARKAEMKNECTYYHRSKSVSRASLH